MKKLLTICLLFIAGFGAKAQSGGLTLINTSGAIAYVTLYATSPGTLNFNPCDIQCVQVTLAASGPGSTRTWPNAAAALSGMGILNQAAGGTATPVTAGTDPGFAWCGTQVQYSMGCSNAIGDPGFGAGGICTFLPTGCFVLNWTFSLAIGTPRSNVIASY